MAMLFMCAGATVQSQTAGTAAASADGSALPGPAVPSASVAKPRLQDSVHERRALRELVNPGAAKMRTVRRDAPCAAGDSAGADRRFRRT